MGDFHFLLLFVWTGPFRECRYRGALRAVLSGEQKEEEMYVWVTRSERSSAR